MQPIDRIFLSISAHHDTLSPDTRVNSIYPRYLDQAWTPGDGLTMRAFRTERPMAARILLRETPALTARCMRDRRRPACAWRAPHRRRRLTFRFPRSWLSQWRDVADAMERLTTQLHGRKTLGRPTDQIVFEDRHLELERAIIVLVVDEQHADELLADIDLGGIVLLRPWHDADLGIAEYALEIGVELSDFLNVHGGLQSIF